MDDLRHVVGLVVTGDSRLLALQIRTDVGVGSPVHCAPMSML